MHWIPLILELWSRLESNICIEKSSRCSDWEGRIRSWWICSVLLQIFLFWFISFSAFVVSLGIIPFDGCKLVVPLKWLFLPSVWFFFFLKICVFVLWFLHCNALQIYLDPHIDLLGLPQTFLAFDPEAVVFNFFHLFVVLSKSVIPLSHHLRVPCK